MHHINCKFHIRSLRQVLVENSVAEAGSEELRSTLKFLNRCLRLNPHERASAKELASDPWLKDK